LKKSKEGSRHPPAPFDKGELRHPSTAFFKGELYNILFIQKHYINFVIKKI